jgi:hypothetical protein
MKCVSIRVFTFPVALIVVSLMLLGHPSAVQAQSSLLKADIPFDFFVGGEILPAGLYDLKLIAGSVIQVRSDKGSTAMVVMTIPSSSSLKAPEPFLVFNRYGNDHFLSEVRWSGYSIGRALIKSSIERELAKNISPVQVVSVTKAP